MYCCYSQDKLIYLQWLRQLDKEELKRGQGEKIRNPMYYFLSATIKIIINLVA
jgi:hypothetical protein